MPDPITQPDTQKQRWLKYGGNVALASVVVVALAILVVYLAQSSRQRVDTTTSGNYSLKPQTKAVVKDLTQPIRLISLYSAPTPDDYKARTGTESDADRRARADLAAARQMRHDAVADLLQEYARTSDKVRAEAIDPLANPGKVDALVAEVTETYGGEVGKYKAFLAKYPATYAALTDAAAAEVSKLAALPSPEALESQQAFEGVALAIFTIQSVVPQRLKSDKARIDRQLDQKPPDYKGAVDGIDDSMQGISGLIGQAISNFEASKADEKVPAAFRAYMNESLPRYAAIKKIADDVAAEIDGLGELKLDALRQSLSAPDSILVLGASDIKVLSREQVWQADVDRRPAGPGGPQTVRPKFAGEQQVSTAILSLTQKPKKVVFVRPGGPPLAEAGVPGFRRGGPLGSVADRLREYNFEVLEKDLSGSFAMQSQMQGGPPVQEPTDAEIKDAVWVVINVPQPQNPMMGMTPTIAPKVLEHLSAGGSALVLNAPQADDLAEALGEWGASIATGQLLVHESAGAGSERSSDMIEEAKKVPYIFVLNDYGDHLLAKPLAALDSVMVPLLPVRTTPVPGVTATPLLPIPQSPPAWAEANAEAMFSDPAAPAPTFDEKAGDVGPPLFGGAALEREGKGRLVVLGSMQFAFNDIVNLPDPDLAQRGVFAARFPANAELFVNSVFWLANMETMIAISPAAMEVSRIGPVSPAMLRFWRVGVLLIGLPALVVLAGVGVYWSRRD